MMLFLFASPGLLSLSLLILLTQAQISTVNGVALYRGTTVSQNQYGIPTLTYNCAKVPALCENVHQQYPLATTVHQAAQAVVTGRHTILGAQSYIQLHFDRDSNSGARRGAACSSRWKLTHNCPEGNQPETVPADAILGDGSFPPTRWNPNNLVIGQSGYNRIGNAAGQFSGMMWTCDEFPFASSIEGGSGARTYCTPQNAACGGTTGLAPGAVMVDSEQNFQSNALTTLRDAVLHRPQRPLKKSDIKGIWRYHFKTEFNPDTGLPAVTVEYYEADTGFVAGYQNHAINGRDVEESILRTVHGFHSNGTVEVKHEPVFKDEYKILRRSWDQHLLGNGSAVGFEEDILKRSTGQMSRRDDDGAVQCDFVTPCPDGSCCNKKGQCGYGEEVCGAKVCVSNCKATAACGKDSLDGKVKCPLNVCCSAYGYCGVEDDFCEAGNQDNSCQKGFGSCARIEPPSCGGRSALARSIGYYQFANVRERQCNRIAPKHIRTEGFTHLYGAFATIDPDTFAVKPSHEDDVKLYKEFTSLKKKGLETWIAIGGWAFNDPGPTRTTFSDLSASPARRSRFIKSLISFLDEHGFQGVDLDWEYPGAPDRGGLKEDVDNYVSLLKDIRAAFGTKYGISIAIPTSYWYLRWFKPKEIEQYVDHMGIMTYDLHGPWDKDTKQVGRVILGHTNIPEIANWSLPLYYAGVNPAKVNLGLAYYARGYTVSDSNCNGIGCKWSSTSRPAPCTNFGGVMSLEEIERMIKEEPGIKPKLLPEDMMMELKFGNQWIGYDNEDTILMKKKWASSRCFGGTMVWSVDMYSGSGSGDTPDDQSDGDSADPGGGQGNGSGIIYIDPEIWEEEQPEVKCQPPCTMVLPPSSLKKPVKLTIPPYETSLDVAWSGTDGWHSTIQKTTLTPPVVTVTTVDVWHITIREDRTKMTTIWSTFTITPSVKVPTFIVTNKLPETSKDGATQPPGTRTITPPPYPWTITEPTTKPSDKPDDDDDVLPRFPVVTWRPGKSGPTCKKGCGKPCRLFCDHPCLLNCPDGGGDFADPKNPKPPKRPVPPNPTIPKPTGKEVKPNKIPTPGTKPENKEHEEDERQCAIEFGLPLPTWRDPATTTHVKRKSTPPKPSPKPDPKPPSPNRKTEKVKCYDSGVWIDRALAIEALEYFCDKFEGQVLDATNPDTERTLKCSHGVVCLKGLGCDVDVVMSVTVKNGCRFTMGSKGPKSECGRILRRIIDECDRSSVRYKQGGTLSSNCADWRFDPEWRTTWTKNSC